MRRALQVAGLALLCCACGEAVPERAGQDVIVRWETPDTPLAARLQEVESVLGVSVEHVREMSGEAHVLRLRQPLDEHALDAALGRLAALPQVRYAVRDQRRSIH